MLAFTPDQPINRIYDLLPWDLIGGSAPSAYSNVKPLESTVMNIQ